MQAHGDHRAGEGEGFQAVEHQVGQGVGAVAAVGADAAEEQVLAKVVDGIGRVGGVAEAFAMARRPGVRPAVHHRAGFVAAIRRIRRLAGAWLVEFFAHDLTAVVEAQPRAVDQLLRLLQRDGAGVERGWRRRAEEWSKRPHDRCVPVEKSA